MFLWSKLTTSLLLVKYKGLLHNWRLLNWKQLLALSEGKCRAVLKYWIWTCRSSFTLWTYPNGLPNATISGFYFQDQILGFPHITLLYQTNLEHMHAVEKFSQARLKLETISQKFGSNKVQFELWYEIGILFTRKSRTQKGLIMRYSWKVYRRA